MFYYNVLKEVIKENTYPFIELFNFLYLEIIVRARGCLWWGW